MVSGNIQKSFYSPFSAFSYLSTMIINFWGNKTKYFNDEDYVAARKIFVLEQNMRK